MKSNKATGPDMIPAEQFKASEPAVTELHQVLQTIWREEDIPQDFVLADMMLLYKKKCRNNRANYRCLGLLNHSNKIFAMVLLMRIMPFITPKLSDTQAGFRKRRGCRDNVFILVTTIQHLLQSAETEAQSRGIITYIDFTAAFDSILHSYLFNALKQYGVPPKYCRLVQCVYKSAKARVRLQEPGGNRSHSRSIEIRRGVIQGDIPSPICFLVALDKLLKDHGSLHQGVKLTDLLHLSDLEYADDAAFPDESAELATNRLTILDAKAKDEAGMEISIPKTKAQHICKRPKVTCTTEDDIVNLPPEKQFKYKCEKCDMTYPTQQGLNVHKGRWCKKRKTKRKPVSKERLPIE